MRISDWSSDVCSSDLAAGRQGGRAAGGGRQGLCHRNRQAGAGGDLAFDSRRPMAEKVGFTPEASTSASSPPLAAAPLPASVDETLTLLASARYLGERRHPTVHFFALKPGPPSHLAGRAGLRTKE